MSEPLVFYSFFHFVTDFAFRNPLSSRGNHHRCSQQQLERGGREKSPRASKPVTRKSNLRNYESRGHNESS
jgi:hypothetical protein